MTIGNQVPDKVLLQNVLKKMAQKGTGGNRVSATVSGGDATITGTISYEHDRKPILRSVSSISGVRRVIDQLTLVVKKKPQHQNASPIRTYVAPDEPTPVDIMPEDTGAS